MPQHFATRVLILDLAQKPVGDGNALRMQGVRSLITAPVSNFGEIFHNFTVIL